MPIDKHEVVAIKGGYVFDAVALRELEMSLGLAEIQVSDGLFIGPTSEHEREGGMLFLNHSCAPNVRIQGQIVFVAMRPIEAGEELTFDSATTDDDSYKLKWNCGASNCRRTITGEYWRLNGIQERYRGYIVWPIIRRIEDTN